MTNPHREDKVPEEIEAFWTMYKVAKDILDTVHVRPDSQSGLDQALNPARDELKWAIEELAYDAAHLKDCMENMTQALRAAGQQINRLMRLLRSVRGLELTDRIVL